MKTFCEMRADGEHLTPSEKTSTEEGESFSDTKTAVMECTPTEAIVGRNPDRSFSFGPVPSRPTYPPGIKPAFSCPHLQAALPPRDRAHAQGFHGRSGVDLVGRQREQLPAFGGKHVREHVGGHVSRPSPLPIPTLDPRAANPSGESRRGGQVVRVDEPPGCEPTLTEQATGYRPETCSNL